MTYATWRRQPAQPHLEERGKPEQLPDGEGPDACAPPAGRPSQGPIPNPELEVKRGAASRERAIEVRASSLDVLGSGLVPLVVAADPTLTPESKAIYALLVGILSSDEGSWTVRQLLACLAMGSNRFYRHRRLLIEHGLVSVHQPDIFHKAVYEVSDGSEYYGDLAAPGATLAGALEHAREIAELNGADTPGSIDGDEVVLASDARAPERAPRLGAARPGAGRLAPPDVLEEDLDDPRHTPAPPVPAVPRPDSRVGVHAYDREVSHLLGTAITGSDEPARVRDAYLELIDRGWAPADIQRAYDAYVVDHVDHGRTPAVAMRLENFLSKGNGVRYWALQARRRASAPAEVPSGPEKRPCGKAPTLDEVRALCASRGYPVDPEVFWNHYDALGWRNGSGAPICKWQSALANWAINDERRRAENLPRIPERDDVAAFAKERGLVFDVDEFMSYWNSRGWRFSGGAPVKDWGAAAETFAAQAKKHGPKAARHQGGRAQAAPRGGWDFTRPGEGERFRASLSPEQRAELEDSVAFHMNPDLCYVDVGGELMKKADYDAMVAREGGEAL